MYSISGFGGMINDTVRMDAYVQALRRVITTDSVVLDIGTGTGVFAVLAHRFGARRVIAIEPNDAIIVAREIAAANGCGEAIEFHQALSTEVSLTEPADVILSDLRGVLPFFQHHIPALVDARRRLLAPNGVLIPQHDEIWLSVVEEAEAYGAITVPWTANPYGLDMRAGARLLVNQWTRIAANAAQLLADPVLCGTLDYQTIEAPDFASEVRLVASRDGIAHGLCVWFDATLAPGIGFSNAPGLPGATRPIYRNGFFPFLKPVDLRAGDVITIALKADLVGGDYLWRWDTHIVDQSEPDRVKADFHQSTLAGEPFSLENLRKRASDHVPDVNEDGEIDRAILQLMHSGVSLGEIASHIASEHSQRFRDWHQALARVGELSLRYSH